MHQLGWSLGTPYSVWGISYRTLLGPLILFND